MESLEGGAYDHLASMKPQPETSDAAAFRTAFDVPWNVTIAQLREQGCPVGYRKHHLKSGQREYLQCASASGHIEITRDNALCMNENLCGDVLGAEKEDPQRERNRYIALINMQLPQLNAAMVWARRNWIFENLVLPVVPKKDAPKDSVADMVTIKAAQRLGSIKTDDYCVCVNWAGYYDEDLTGTAPAVKFVPLMQRKAKDNKLTRGSRRLLMAMINTFDDISGSGKKSPRYWDFLTEQDETKEEAADKAREELSLKIKDFQVAARNFLKVAESKDITRSAVTHFLADQRMAFEEGSTTITAVGALQAAGKKELDSDKLVEADYAPVMNTLALLKKASEDAKKAEKDASEARHILTTENCGLYLRVMAFLVAVSTISAAGFEAITKPASSTLKKMQDRLVALARVGNPAASSVVLYDDGKLAMTDAFQKAEQDVKTAVLGKMRSLLFNAYVKHSSPASKPKNATNSYNGKDRPFDDINMLKDMAAPESGEISIWDREQYRVEFRDLDLRVAVVTGLEVVYVGSILNEARFSVYPTKLFAWSDKLEQLSTAVQRYVNRVSTRKFFDRVYELRQSNREFADLLNRRIGDGGALLQSASSPQDMTADEQVNVVLEEIYKCMEYASEHPEIKTQQDLELRTDTVKIADEDVPVRDMCVVENVGGKEKIVPKIIHTYLTEPQGPLEKMRVDNPDDTAVPLFREVTAAAAKRYANIAERRDYVLGGK